MAEENMDSSSNNSWPFRLNNIPHSGSSTSFPVNETRRELDEQSKSDSGGWGGRKTENGGEMRPAVAAASDKSRSSLAQGDKEPTNGYASIPEDTEEFSVIFASDTDEDTQREGGLQHEMVDATEEAVLGSRRNLLLNEQLLRSPISSDETVTLDTIQNEDVEVHLPLGNAEFGVTRQDRDEGRSARLKKKGEGSRSRSHASERRTTTEGVVRSLLKSIVDRVARRGDSPSSDDAQLLISLPTEGLDIHIKEEGEEGPSKDALSRDKRPPSTDSFQSTEYVARPSNRSSSSESDRLLRHLGLTARRSQVREGSEEILPPRFEANRPPPPKRGRPRKTATRRHSALMEGCCVYSKCENYLKTSFNVFPFPDETKPLLRRKWLDAVNNAKGVLKKMTMTAIKKNARYGLCLQHFNRKKDFQSGEKLLLTDTALPFFKDTVTAPRLLAPKQPARAVVGGGVKSQYARKTVVAVTKLTGKKALLKIVPPPTQEEEDVSEGEEVVDDSDRDVDWDKSADAKVAERRRSMRKKRKRNGDSTSESDDGQRHDVLLLRPKVAGKKLSSLPTKALLSGRVLAPSTTVGKASPNALPLRKGPGVTSTTHCPSIPAVPPSGRVTALQAKANRNVHLVLQKITPLPPPPPPHVVMQTPPRLPMASKLSQVEEDYLEADSSDEEIKEILKEAHDEILEMRFDLEECRMDLTAEKRKVELLETRVQAWIRAYFSASTLEAERLQMMDSLASYYLAAAKKADEERKTLKTELDLLRTNYLRSQKETESYRLQIIEQQSASSRDIERIRTAKVKNEKEAQDTISILRHQLAKAVVTAEDAKKAQRSAEENVSRLSQAAKQAAHNSPSAQSQVLFNPKEPSVVGTSRIRRRTGSPGPSQQQMTPPTTSPKKRLRQPKDTATQPHTKKPRESSVDKAVKYLMSL